MGAEMPHLEWKGPLISGKSPSSTIRTLKIGLCQFSFLLEHTGGPPQPRSSLVGGWRLWDLTLRSEGPVPRLGEAQGPAG